MSRITGTVKWFNGARASGFIEEDGQSDVFVRHVVFQGGWVPVTARKRTNESSRCARVRRGCRRRT